MRMKQEEVGSVVGMVLGTAQQWQVCGRPSVQGQVCGGPSV